MNTDRLTIFLDAAVLLHETGTWVSTSVRLDGYAGDLDHDVTTWVERNRTAANGLHVEIDGAYGTVSLRIVDKRGRELVTVRRPAEARAA